MVLFKISFTNTNGVHESQIIELHMMSAIRTDFRKYIYPGSYFSSCLHSTGPTLIIEHDSWLSIHKVTIPSSTVFINIPGLFTLPQMTCDLELLSANIVRTYFTGNSGHLTIFPTPKHQASSPECFVTSLK